MFAVLYIAICIAVGALICSSLLPKLYQVGNRSYTGKELKLHSLYLQLPAWYLTGTMLVTWLVYLAAYGISVTGLNEGTPLLPANIIVLSLMVVLCAALQLRRIHTHRTWRSQICGFTTSAELIIGILVFVFITYMMYMTFRIADGKMYVGYSVFGDFSTHIDMIRSFSKGNNFPTQYSHYAGADVKYHFFFQFMVGNLEFLGMRIDHAFNIPSILSLFSTCVLLYVLAAKLTGKRIVGYLTLFFFLFRSSPSVFRYMAEIPRGESVLKTLASGKEFVSYTVNEDWGLWNLNVYCNQRHFAFSLAVLLLALLLYLPYLYRMWRRVRNLHGRRFLHAFLGSREAIMPARPVFAVFMGILLGAMAFWNGAVLIGCLSVLFVMALASDHRLDYLITAVIAVLMAVLESKLFIRGNAVALQYFYGFIVENKTFWGVLQYLIELWGPLLFLTVCFFVLYKGPLRYLTAAFAAPLFIALHLSMTPDVTVNHKFIMITAMLWSIYPAVIIMKLAELRSAMTKVLAAVLVVAMTATGIYDFQVLRNKNKDCLVYQIDDPATQWIIENTDSKDMFLTAWYSINRVVVAGAMLFDGWPYYAWSAGYNTVQRDEQVKLMYEAADSQTLNRLILDNDISYIIVDAEARQSENYMVREDVIASTYRAVYTDGEGADLFTIYDTKQLLVQ